MRSIWLLGLFLAACWASTMDDYKITSMPLNSAKLPYEMYSGYFPVSHVNATELSMD